MGHSCREKKEGLESGMGKLVSVWYLLAAVALTIIWFVVAKVVDLPIIPSPVLVVENLADIFMKYIAIHSLYSLWRIAALGRAA